LPEPSPSRLPRWRGFNLLEKFTLERNAPFRESDFDFVREWGFDFVRLPMDYRTWIVDGDALRFNDATLAEIDQAIRYGRERGIHVNLNFHRAPGYCVNPPAEALDLWTDPRAQELAGAHWAHFAERYRGIPNRELSFDLVNEPADIPAEQYDRVARGMVAAIRAVDPERLIIADGLYYGNRPMPSLADLGVAQSTRGYMPIRLTHYRASWSQGSETWPVPAWPLVEGERVWDRERLRADQIEPWKALERQGVGVHVGEWGAYQFTPHAAALAWMRDCLALWKEAGWGWALWNLRDGFGVLDSNREDVAYEPFRGHKLDRKMLELLREN
jgi:endoglucanase